MANIKDIVQAVVAGVTKINETTPQLTKARADAEEAASQLAQMNADGTSAHMRTSAAKLAEAEQHLAAAVQAANEASASAVAAQNGSSGLLGQGSRTAASAPTSSTGSISHGARQRRAGVMEGPVIFSAPKGATSDEAGQAKEYVDAANTAHRDGKLSPTGRVRLDRKASRAKDRAAAKERERAAAAGKPYGQDVAAHLPDTTWAGSPDPPGGWGRHTKKVNSSLGAQSALYPVGYRPTQFRLDHTWTRTDTT